jgi:hypothetical protein
LLFNRAGNGKKERAMKKIKYIGWLMAFGLAAALFVAGCGGSDGLSADLNSGGDDNGGTGISNIFDSPAEMGVGDIMPIEFGEGETEVSVDFSDVDSDAQFILAVGSYDYTGGPINMQLGTASESLPAAGAQFRAMEIEGQFSPEQEYGPQEIMSAWLRASESTLSETEVRADAAANVQYAKSLGIKALGVGSDDTFRVLSSLTSSNSYVEVDAEVRCIGDNVVIYVDKAVTDYYLSDSDVNELCEDFDDASHTEMALLGDFADVDGDGKVHVLMTKQINELGALGGGIITGYFYAGDYYERSSTNPVSNYRDIIYTMVPDPDGTYGTQVSKEFAMSNLLPAVLPHELQHAINYNQHVFVSGGQPEEDWLNEAMSHFMEDYLGEGNENPSRYEMYLASPSTYGVVTQSSPNLMERGGAYLFLRYLYEQASDGGEFLSALERSGKIGVDNLESSFTGPANMDTFSEMMSRWVVALIMTNRGISQDSRYIYRDRTIDSRTGNWKGACLSCDANDNRGTALTGVNLNPYYGYHTVAVDSTTAKFFEMTMLPNTMTVQGSHDDGSFGILVRTQ